MRRFPSAVEDGSLASRWLEEACATRSSDELFCALVIGVNFGFAAEDREILCWLIGEDWHYSHEDVVSTLGRWPNRDTIEALFRATQWIPKSLEYDDARALAVKAIWALGKIPGIEAEAKLLTLAQSEDTILRENALKQLGLRHSSG